MEKGDFIKTCNCLFNRDLFHTTVTDKNDYCIYCGCHAVIKKATVKDVRQWKQYRNQLHDAKWKKLVSTLKQMRRERENEQA